MQRSRINKRLLSPRVVITPFLPPNVFTEHMPGARRTHAGGIDVLSSPDITVVRSGIGAAAVQETVAALAGTVCLQVFFLGSCGGLEESGIGDIILPGKAFDARQWTDVVSLASCRSAAADERLLRAAGTNLSSRGIFFREGTIASLEIPDAGDKQRAAAFRENIIAGVDLETFSFFDASLNARIPSLALLYVTDLPGIKPFSTRHTKDDREKIRCARAAAVDTLIQFIHSL